MVISSGKRILDLPVVVHGKVTGMISIGDVVKLRIEAIEREAADRKAYIAGSSEGLRISALPLISR